MILGSGLIQASVWPQASDWLIRDEFTDTRAAGSVNGTAATPGPGTRTQTVGTLSISDGYARPSGAAALAYGARTRAAGLTAVSRHQLGGTQYGTSGFSNLSTGGGDSAKIGVLGSAVYLWDTSLVSLSGAGVTAEQDLWMATVLRTAGAIYLVKRATSWTLEWVGVTNSTATLYPTIDGKNPSANPIFDYIRVIALPAPFDTDDGLATDTKSGSVAAGTTFTHAEGCLIEATITTVPSADNIDIVFRQQDASNYWICRVATGGDISLQEVVAGTPTQRGVAAGVVSNGHRVVVIADGTTIKIFSNNTLRITYSSASSSATATAGEVDALGTGGAVSNIKTWPRTLSGTAASILNKASG